MRRVLVTGANGFVGLPLCKRLQQSGWEVIAAVRTKSSLKRLPAGVHGVVCGDLSEAGGLGDVLSGVDAVVHLAARAHIVGDTAGLDAYLKVNVDGTKQVLEACHKAGVRRLVYLSSIKAAGEGRSTPYKESDPCDPVDAYGISKAKAEALVREHGKLFGLETVIVRPPLVYGPNVRANFLRLLTLAGRGWPLPLGSVNNARSMVFIENLTDALELCLEHQQAVGQTFFVADDDALSTPELIRRLAAHQGRQARLVPFPLGFLRAGAGLLGRSGDVDRLTGSLVVETTHLKQTLGWVPPFSVDEGLEATAQWFQQSKTGGAG